jgi:hypothetical protein
MKTSWSLGTRVFVVVLLVVLASAVALFWRVRGPSEARHPFVRDTWLATRHLEQLSDPGHASHVERVRRAWRVT